MSILYFFADLFGYVLNFLYSLIGNYGVAIIIFSILAKLIMLPLTIKQQKTMKKTAKIQEEMKQIQFKYKNDPEKMNQEVMALYKREDMSPFSGCLSSIVQIILVLAVFILVSSPLTYMVKLDKEEINKLNEVVSQEQPTENRYKEIAIIRYIRNLGPQTSVSEEGKEEVKDVDERESENQEFNVYDYIEKVDLNMDFFGIDLSAVPTDNLSNWKALIIPVLYVITSFISIRLTTATQIKKQKESNLITDGSEEAKKEEEINPMLDANKSMSWFMPIMSISIAIIAPLGLALYWLMNNILMIVERLVLNKFMNKEEETNNV